MIINNFNSTTGFYFKLEHLDFHYGNWKLFISKIKKLGASYQPAELDDPEHFWYLPNNHRNTFDTFKNTLLDIAIKTEHNYNSLGYKPIPR